MEKVIIGFRNEEEVENAIIAIKTVYSGIVEKTNDKLGLKLPNKVLDWSLVLCQENVPFRGLITIKV